MSIDKAKLIYGNEEIELPVYEGQPAIMRLILPPTPNTA